MVGEGRSNAEAQLFTRIVALASLVGVLAFAAVAYVRGDWQELSTVLYSCLFAVAVGNLVVFGFFGGQTGRSDRSDRG